MSKFELQNGVAVVTGAASGIGAALALGLAARGCHLAVADRNGYGLSVVAARARAAGIEVSEHVFDVTDVQAIAGLPARVVERHRRVTLLVNNAGAAMGGRFEEISVEELAWLFEVNFWSVVRMMHAFLPVLRREAAAQIVNISSLFGLISPPGQSAYCATKFAVRAVSEVLRHELEEGNGPVRLTVVHPGGVRTHIVANARQPAGVTRSEAEIAEARASYERLLSTPPEQVAAEILRGVERRKKRILTGASAQTGDRLQRLLPANYWTVMRNLARR